METEELEKILEEKSKNYWWLFKLFILASSPGIFNSMHITSYVFMSDNPKFWCDIPLLRNANWTDEQIRNVSVADPQATQNCLIYKWDYENFLKIGYEDAMKFIESNRKPSQEGCTRYRYEQEKPSIVSEWDLVCERSTHKTLAQVAVALGKFVGAFILGFIADKFGRKKCFTLSCILYMISGPIAGFAQDYYLFLIMRLFIGVAGSGVYENGYTILTELTVKQTRTRLGCLYNLSYSIGLIILPALAYFSQDWRHLQYYMSFPAFILLVHCWFLPKSPRWLITQGRFEEANEVIYDKKKLKEINSRETNSEPVRASKVNIKGKHAEHYAWYKKLYTATMRLFKIYSTSELRNRILICYFGWFVAALTYFVIALNADNFTVDKYAYVAINGLCESPGYLVPLLALAFIGRKLAATSLFIMAGIALLIILLITNSTAVMVVALVGRFCISAAYAVIILQTSELFPTSHRNSALGTSVTMAQLGAIVAPFIVDILGAIAWYIPSTFCGVISIMAGLLILMLPETRNKVLPDHVRDLQGLPSKEKVSCMNCFTFV